jgi:hypothetical protein
MNWGEHYQIWKQEIFFVGLVQNHKSRYTDGDAFTGLFVGWNAGQEHSFWLKRPGSGI